MTEVAGEVADGLLVHPFTTERYLREVTLPALERGLAASGRSRHDVQISFSGLVATGEDEAARRISEGRVRSQIAFYGSTPAYRPVLELHGWGDLQTQLNALSRNGDWDAMGDLISDDVLDALSIVAAAPEVGARVVERFGDLIDRFSIYAPYTMSADLRRSVALDVRRQARS